MSEIDKTEHRALPQATVSYKTKADDSSLPLTELEHLDTHVFMSPIDNTTAFENISIVPKEKKSPSSREYMIGALLGSGGMGEVFQVDDVLLERQLAMKVLRPEMMNNQDVISRFLKEAQLTGQLQHPGIVPVHDMGTLPDGRVYFTMREIRGRSFYELIQMVHNSKKNNEWQITHDGWGLQRLIQTFHTICDTMAYAHSEGIIHCDLKPANVMVGNFGEVLIVDWGIARDIWNTLDKSPRIEGTPAYMSPEQAIGINELIDTRSDVYALGVILYHILCGKHPFHGCSAEEIINHLSTEQAIITLDILDEGMGKESKINYTGFIDRETQPPPPSALIEICETAMERDRQLRYSSAKELAEAIRAWLNGTEQRDRALKVLESADACLEEAHFLEKKAKQRLRKAQETLNSLPDWEDEEKKFPLWKDEESANDMEYRAKTLRGQRLLFLEAALTHKPDMKEAHSQLLEHYLTVHAEAEKKSDRIILADAEARLYNHLDHLAILDPLRKRTENYLSGMGNLLLQTADEVEVYAHRNTHQYRRFYMGDEQSLGTSPIMNSTLPIGSYTLRLISKKQSPVLFPIEIRRQQTWDSVPPNKSHSHPIELPNYNPEKECYVPAGWFHFGGDSEAVAALPETLAWLDGFIILKHHVQNQDYLQFLNALHQAKQTELALRYAPRDSSVKDDLSGELQYGFSQAEGFFLQPDKDGDIWDPQWPVCMIDYASAIAYASWLSKKTEKEWRLPSELEWEKSARGVDRRSYPWGNGFEATWACMRNSKKGINMPVRITENTVDTSPYGLRHMAGNMCEWTSSQYSESGPILNNGRELLSSVPNNAYRVFKGGSWVNYSNYLRCASRYRSKESDRFRTIGFRLLRALK